MTHNEALIEERDAGECHCFDRSSTCMFSLFGQHPVKTNSNDDDWHHTPCYKQADMCVRGAQKHNHNVPLN